MGTLLHITLYRPGNKTVRTSVVHLLRQKLNEHLTKRMRTAAGSIEQEERAQNSTKISAITFRPCMHGLGSTLSGFEGDSGKCAGAGTSNVNATTGALQGRSDGVSPTYEV